MLVTALLAVFGYIGPFWQIIDPWRARGPSSAFLDDAHLSQDVLPGVALQGYRYFWRSSQLLYLIFDIPVIMLLYSRPSLALALASISA